MKELNSGSTLTKAAIKSEMSINCARKYRNGSTIDELKVEHTWQTRNNPFAEDWHLVEEFLNVSNQIEAKTLFEHLQRLYPGKYQDGQLRTLQRKISNWKALNTQKIVMFPQVHKPGMLCASDYTWMDELDITISHQHFKHKLYHFVLTYSNWEHVTICHSENFESLSLGLQNALHKLGYVPFEHLTDRLAAAVNSSGVQHNFQAGYAELLDHYGIAMRATNAYSPNENGDVEQSNHRLKRAVNQMLILRGSRDFKDVAEYEIFIHTVVDMLNKGRQSRLQEEYAVMRELPENRTLSYRIMTLKVTRSSTITVSKNIYSVPSSLIGKQVRIHLHSMSIDVFYGQNKVESFDRIPGESKHYVNYRHVIHSLIRKPGAFENYRYQSSMFPTSQFRMAYDILQQKYKTRAVKEYLAILQLAATGIETQVHHVLEHFHDNDMVPKYEQVEHMYEDIQKLPKKKDHVEVDDVELKEYDSLLEYSEDYYE
jgi:hypothetical protein